MEETQTFTTREDYNIPDYQTQEEADADFPNRNWRVRLFWTSSNHMHAMIVGILGVMPKNEGHPYFSGKAMITSDDFVMATFHIPERDEVHQGALACHAEELFFNLTNQFIHCGLTDEERIEAWRTVKDWIDTDYSNNFTVLVNTAINMTEKAIERAATNPIHPATLEGSVPEGSA